MRKTKQPNFHGRCPKKTLYGTFGSQYDGKFKRARLVENMF